MIWKDVYTTLHGYSGVSNLVGTRIYPTIVNQDPTYPCITHFRVSESGQIAIGGAVGLINPTWQVDAWATTYSDADALMTQIKAAMAAATLFKSVFVNQIDNIDRYEGDLGIHHILAEFSLWAS